MVFFAFTTLLGNCFYCDNLLIYIHKKQPEKAFMKGFRLVSALAIFLGAGMEMSLLWDLSDVLMGVMALINIPVTLASTAPTSMIPEVSAHYAMHDI